MMSVVLPAPVSPISSMCCASACSGIRIISLASVVTKPMPLVISMAVSQFGMSVTEALRAATLGGAHALRAPDRGAMARARFADIVAWDADHEGAFAWSYALFQVLR